MEVDGQLHAPAGFTTVERTSADRVGGWLDPRGGPASFGEVES
jgi:hypothetical protein